MTRDVVGFSAPRKRRKVSPPNIKFIGCLYDKEKFGLLTVLLEGKSVEKWKRTFLSTLEVYLVIPTDLAANFNTSFRIKGQRLTTHTCF